jgi:hypothetical protein
MSWVARALLVPTLLGLSACESVSFIDRVAIVNDTAYTANTDVRGRNSGWLGLTTVEPEATNEVGQVIDQGELWIFRFAYGAHDPVEIEISRKELVDANWQIEVPSEFEEGLSDAGVPPPP